MSNNLLLSRLLMRGDHASIEQGSIKIRPKSGKTIDSEWLAANTEQLITETAQLLNINVFRYIDFDTGNYQHNGRPIPGLTLQLQNMRTKSKAYSTFNAHLKRTRASKKHKKGSQYSGKQFNPPKQGNFIKFWQSTSLKTPPRNTSYHDYMGNLRSLFYTATYTPEKPERLDTSSITPLTASYEQLTVALYQETQPYIPHTTSGQQPYNSRTNVPYKESATHQAEQEVEPSLATGINNYGNKVIRECGNTDIPSTPINQIYKTPQEQSNDEWEDQYDKRDQELKKSKFR